MNRSIVVMGVAGCGKSTLAAAIAEAEKLPLIEGDDFHSAANRAKMSQGVALTDADRDGWLAVLGQQIQARPLGLVLTCSALKRSYRDRLRSARPGLLFVFLQIDRDAALERVAARAATHFYPASLVDSQFAALEDPAGEPGVLTLDATHSRDTLRQAVLDWLQETR